MSIVLMKLRECEEPLAAAAARVHQLPYPDHRRHAALDHREQRRFTAKHGIAVGQLHPGVRQLLAVQNVQRLENSQQQ